jgi:cysteine desulfurase/selenocysteine lyase
LVAFSHPTAHASDLAFFLDQEGVAVRSGHHCTQPLHRDVLKVASTCRASLYLYNDLSDVAALVAALKGSLDLLAATAPVDVEPAPALAKGARHPQ